MDDNDKMLDNLVTLLKARTLIRKTWNELDAIEFQSIDDRINAMTLKKKLYWLYVNTDTQIKLN